MSMLCTNEDSNVKLPLPLNVKLTILDYRVFMIQPNWWQKGRFYLTQNMLKEIMRL